METAGMVPHNMVTTAFELPNFRIVQNLGVARGIIVLDTVGGNISLYHCERMREDSFSLMLEHAGAMGANAVIGARYESTDIMGGVTEVLAYGTAVVVEAVR